MTELRSSADRFAGRVVLVTGAGQGIGRALAEAFASAGARVAVNDVDGGAARQCADAIETRGGAASAHAADVGDEAAVNAMVAEIAAARGGLDVVVNNAYWRARASTTEALASADFDRCLRTAVYGTFYVCRAAYPHLKRSRGSIVNLGSEGSEQPPLPAMVDYAAAKAGVRAIGKALAREWGADGIRVNTVWPNATTPLWNAYAEAHPEEMQRMIGEIALGRPGDAALDIAPVVLFLASEDARFVTGQTLVANGGRTML